MQLTAIRKHLRARALLYERAAERALARHRYDLFNRLRTRAHHLLAACRNLDHAQQREAA